MFLIPPARAPTTVSLVVVSIVCLSAHRLVFNPARCSLLLHTTYPYPHPVIPISHIHGPCCCTKDAGCPSLQMAPCQTASHQRHEKQGGDSTLCTHTFFGATEGTAGPFCRLQSGLYVLVARARGRMQLQHVVTGSVPLVYFSRLYSHTSWPVANAVPRAYANGAFCPGSSDQGRRAQAPTKNRNNKLAVAQWRGSVLVAAMHLVHLSSHLISFRALVRR